jgi:hypothetical protein
MNQDHIHRPDDGRGRRDVFVNGNKIEGVAWADTKNGVAVFYPQPIRVKRGTDEVYTRKLRGKVEVVPCG